MLLTPHTKIRAATQRPKSKSRSVTGPNDIHLGLDEIGADHSVGESTRGATQLVHA